MCRAEEQKENKTGDRVEERVHACQPNILAMGFSYKTRGGRLLVKNPWIALISLVVSFSCLLIVAMLVLRLPEASPLFFRTSKLGKASPDQKIGLFGRLMLEMLPDDLAFTVFIPSERAFERDLGLQVNQSLVRERWNDTYAVLSRVLGFSAIPLGLFSHSVQPAKEVCYDSISGFRLYISKDLQGMLVVNGVRSTQVDLRRKEAVAHVMNGVLMDAEFEQSVRPDYDE